MENVKATTTRYEEEIRRYRENVIRHRNSSSSSNTQSKRKDC